MSLSAALLPRAVLRRAPPSCSGKCLPAGEIEGLRLGKPEDSSYEPIDLHGQGLEQLRVAINILWLRQAAPWHRREMWPAKPAISSSRSGRTSARLDVSMICLALSCSEPIGSLISRIKDDRLADCKVAAIDVTMRYQLDIVVIFCRGIGDAAGQQTP